jgi:hypothetical protein
MYRVAALDRCGRLAERSVMRALRWSPALRLDIAEAAGALIVRADPAGAFRTTGHGHLVLPARVRSWCGLRPGDRVLLAADPMRQELLVCPPAVLDAMIAARRPPSVDTVQSADRGHPMGGGPA